jgi:hypothetical protein
MVEAGQTPTTVVGHYLRLVSDGSAGICGVGRRKDGENEMRLGGRIWDVAFLGSTTAGSLLCNDFACGL